MTQTNQNIRKAAAEAGVKLWQIADKLGYTDSCFSRLLRKELPVAPARLIVNAGRAEMSAIGNGAG